MKYLKKVVPGVTAALLTLWLAKPAIAQDPEMMADDTWISVSGTVSSVAPDIFVLNYDSGTIAVEMDDGDRDADAYKLMVGDTVTVNGIIDHDFLEAKSIEASSVYVSNLGTTFYASALDEEDHWSIIPSPIVPNVTVLEGTVTDVSDDQFMVDLGTVKLPVTVDEMLYNPLDEEGYQKVRVGDRVRVTGHSDYELFEGRVFDATSVVTLWKRDSKM